MMDLKDNTKMLITGRVLLDSQFPNVRVATIKDTSQPVTMQNINVQFLEPGIILGMDTSLEVLSQFTSTLVNNNQLRVVQTRIGTIVCGPGIIRQPDNEEIGDNSDILLATPGCNSVKCTLTFPIGNHLASPEGS
ncbi:unnamed protein product [Bursaphelenchus okinawaensis]|uniref:Uncharacterized protein n=1 Tax=Bursaphelenchus okinawaensis TaxID=465554 RepID=A0A811LJU9_9BILA|nr:unnamed protein product [Bursaphelenchus okinawaensis]CAG9124985.1 unnamed protein product [Bursaphelenchus okinawaensis]